MTPKNRLWESLTNSQRLGDETAAVKTTFCEDDIDETAAVKSDFL
jgi:hypothetical protein